MQRCLGRDGDGEFFWSKLQQCDLKDLSRTNEMDIVRRHEASILGNRLFDGKI